MKRFLLIGLLFLGLDNTLTYAQNRGTYQDDIYYNSEDAKRDAEIEAKEAKARAERNRENERNRESENVYSSSGNSVEDNGDNRNYNRSYESDDEDYIDYDDDYYYSNRIRRFNNPYWGFGYYTPYYDPFWYDPFYGPWSYGPTVSISVGWGWGNPYWGWNNWYGYPGFYSAWNYPYYGGGWGGGGYWSGYNHGFYDGFHAGAYGIPYRSVTYGPRTSFNRSATGVRRGVGFNNNTQPQAGPRPQLRQSTDNNTAIENSGRPMRSTERGVASPQRGSFGEVREAPASGRFENRDVQAQPQREVPRRSRFFDNSAASGAENARPVEQPQNNEGRRRSFGQQQQQAPVMRSQPSYEQRSYQQRAEPRYEQSPRMSSPSYSAPERGGGGFGGGRRR